SVPRHVLDTLAEPLPLSAQSLENSGARKPGEGEPRAASGGSDREVARSAGGPAIEGDLSTLTSTGSREVDPNDTNSLAQGGQPSRTNPPASDTPDGNSPGNGGHPGAENEEGNHGNQPGTTGPRGENPTHSGQPGSAAHAEPNCPGNPTLTNPHAPPAATGN